MKTWKDFVLSCCSIVFIAGLFPTLLGQNSHIPLSTSVPTAVALAVQSLVFLTLNMRFASLATAVTSFCWGAIAIWRQ